MMRTVRETGTVLGALGIKRSENFLLGRDYGSLLGRQEMLSASAVDNDHQATGTEH